LEAPTQLADKIFKAGRELLAREADGTKYRLIGIGVSALSSADDADPADLVDQSGRRAAAAEHAIDHLRARFGRGAVVKGLTFGEDD
jgi:DNA polymerase-4